MISGKRPLKTKYDLYERLMKPFGLTISTNTFMRLMHHGLFAFTGKVVVNILMAFLSVPTL